MTESESHLKMGCKATAERETSFDVVMRLEKKSALGRSEVIFSSSIKAAFKNCTCRGNGERQKPHFH